MIVYAVNALGSRSIQKTRFWVCLWWVISVRLTGKGKPTLDCVALFHRLQSRTEPKGKQKLNMNIQVSLPLCSGQWTKSLRLPLPYCPLDSRCHAVPREGLTLLYE